MSYSPFRHISSILWKGEPVQLTLFVTKRCNLRCPFCFYTSDRNLIKDQPELSLDEIEKISSSLGNLLWLAFSGGEIFLRDDIIEITKVFYEKNKPAIILFPTNGLLTGVIKEKIEAILNYCKKSSVVVKLSLEGMEGLHDSIRGTAGGFRKTMRTYEALKGFLDKYPNFDLGINTVFSAANQDHLDELIDFVNKLDGVRTHTVSLIRGIVADERLKDIDAGRYYEVIRKLESNFKKKISTIYRFRGAKLKAAQDILQRRLIFETLMRKERQIPCCAGKLNLVLTETGDVYPCESFTMKMGNVREDGYDLRKMRNSGKAHALLQTIEKNKCFCTHECYMMTNILFNPSCYPALMKEYVQL